MRYLIVFFALVISIPVWAADRNPGSTKRPNIVFMLSDDQAWNGLSVPMHPDVAGSRGDVFNTPNLEKMASQGMRFSAAYAPSPVCSPTRISLQTGKSPAQLHWTKAAPAVDGQKLTEPRLIKQLSVSEVTIAELLRGSGYATAHYGKWHIGGGGPAKHGYDESDGDTGNEHAFQFKDPNPVDIFGMATRAAEFMEKNKKAGKPFFIQMSWNALHASENALKATLVKYEKLGSGKNMTRAAITEDLDTGVGRVLKSLDELGLGENTYVIYMADNGMGAGGRGPLSGGKGDVYEAGIRVPLIVRGPGVKPNSWCHNRVVGYDWFPTFCDWAGVPKTNLPKGIEGGSLSALLSQGGQGKVNRPRDGLFFHFPHYQSGETPHSAIILGDFKLIKHYEDNRLSLFDLSRDLRERTDLSQKLPNETAQLHKRLTDYLTSVNAQLPTINSRFDPNAPNSNAKQGGEKKGQGKMGGGGGQKKNKQGKMD